MKSARLNVWFANDLASPRVEDRHRQIGTIHIVYVPAPGVEQPPDHPIVREMYETLAQHVAYIAQSREGGQGYNTFALMLPDEEDEP